MLRRSRNSTLAALAGLLTLLGAATMSPSTHGQPPSPPPTALPTHSALPEDARNVTAAPVAGNSSPGYSTPPWVQTPPAAGRSPEFTASLPPPSSGAPDFVPSPPLARPQPDGPSFGEMPPPSPLFSWKPTYIPPGAKSGSFQNSLFRTTYLPRFGDGGFGMTDVVKQATFAVPPFISGSPILITPSATTHFLDGPTTVNLPSEVYSFELEFRYMKQLTSRWGMDLAVAPSYFGDLHADAGEAFRVTGRAIAAWDWTPTIKLVFGGLILGREDYPAIPAGGVIWKPNDNWRFDFIMPRPRFAYRYLVDCDVEHYVYLGGEFGGNTWAIDRGGVADKFTYSDLRMMLGWERRTQHGLNGRVELGWVFDRKIELESGLPGFTPDNTIMARGEVSY